MLKEFKEFAMRGNVVDLAVGVVIGGAFGKIVTSFVSDLLMPVLGLLTGGINFSDLAITLKPGSEGHPSVLFGYGKFVQAGIDFLIIAFAIFLFIQLLNKMKKKEEAAPAAPPAPTASETLLAEIRDLLKK